jgi:hypothetical protein
MGAAMKHTKHIQNVGEPASDLISGIKFFAEALRASPINTTSVGSFRFLFILVPFLVRGSGLDCPVFL